LQRIIFLALLFLLFAQAQAAPPPLRNNNFPDKARYQIKDYIDRNVGFVTADITIDTVSVDGRKYIRLESYEGGYYRNSATLNYDDFTTVEEKRYDRQGQLVESFARLADGGINFFHKDRNINLTAAAGPNVYSRYAFLLSLSGFPFEQKDKVVLNVYMFEYGNALPLRAVYQGQEKIKTPGGEFLCHKLELAVDGVLGLFAPDKYYLYFTVEPPQHFVRFDQKVDDGRWLSNELLKARY
jgi:hypothetical protein